MPRKQLASSETPKRSVEDNKVNPVFFKELPLVLQYQGKPELVHFAVGFSKTVDPMSGMTVNLKDIMDWQEQWKQMSSVSLITSWFEFFQQAHSFFQKKAALQKAESPIQQIRFFDSSILRFENGQFVMTKSQSMVDTLGRLRICHVQWILDLESDIQRIREYPMRSELPGTWDDSDLILNLFESELGLKAQRLELEDPISKIATLIS